MHNHNQAHLRFRVAHIIKHPYVLTVDPIDPSCDGNVSAWLQPAQASSTTDATLLHVHAAITAAEGRTWALP